MLYGFDVGGTKIAFSVYNDALNCLYSKQVSTPDDYENFLNVINDLVVEADQSFNCKGFVGIGFPGAINSEDESVNCANVKAIKGRTLIKDLSFLLERQVKVENDANCFLLSECYKGSAEDCSTVLGITLGTGLGGAICTNADVISGLNSFAGEIGHYPIPATVLIKHPEIPRLTCGCGRQMCLETYVSGSGLANLYLHYANNSLQAPAIIENFCAGDEIAQKVFNIYFEILAAGVGTAIMVLDPEVIVLGGGLSKFEILTEELIKRLPEHLLNDVQLPLIVNAQFGSAGGVRGAALLNYKNL